MKFIKKSRRPKHHRSPYSKAYREERLNDLCKMQNPQDVTMAYSVSIKP